MIIAPIYPVPGRRVYELFLHNSNISEIFV